ncbi:hypothetical protein IFM89_021424 [Coptis chinensis]|uniref:Uncharacterized protein n=1 Tax=Coptis chinensis TaxID=261450 RepID=A0A835I2R4_9MAGN|nr:hypothetical protein IFM89_021424 [Coptis chinensis]
MMTLGRNDGAITPSFIEGLTLDGPIGHTAKIIYYSGLVCHLWMSNFLTRFSAVPIVARKIAYLIRLPTDEHKVKVGLSWLTKSAVDSIASFQSNVTKVLSGS